MKLKTVKDLKSLITFRKETYLRYGPTVRVSTTNKPVEKLHVPKSQLSHKTIQSIFTSLPKTLPLSLVSNGQTATSCWLNEVDYPSVSEILNLTQSEEDRLRLENWRKRKEKEMGVDKFKEHEKQILQRGRTFHEFVVDRLNKPDAVSTDQSVMKLWSSVQLCTSERVLAEKPSFLEQPVSHPVLCYRGVVDCVGRLSLKEEEAPLSIIEWKTSDRKNRPKRISESFDYPVQMAAYIGALRHSLKRKDIRGTLVYAFTDGSKGTVLQMSEAQCHLYWSIWVERVKAFWKLKLSHVQ
ncbi:hypothetical protein ACOME3_002475 [Neoechinorhynchus agilis]